MSSNDINMHSIIHLDEKILKPKDFTRSGAVVGSKVSKAGLLDSDTRGTGLNKSIVGRPKIYNLSGELLAEEENLVVLSGREFLAQQLSLTPGSNAIDYSNYKITHFGVGDGGTNGGLPPLTIGPFDNDTDLINRVTIGDMTNGGTEPNYLDNGKLKKIEFDTGDINNPISGEITIVEEDHTINTDAGGEIVVQSFTAIRYTMYLQPSEPLTKPFRFNEAGLYAVEYDANGLPTGNYVLFARFTTLDKYLEDADGIMIEWYILV